MESSHCNELHLYYCFMANQNVHCEKQAKTKPPKSLTCYRTDYSLRDKHTRVDSYAWILH